MLNPTLAQLGDGLFAPIAVGDGPPRSAVIEDVPPGTYSVCTWVLPDLAAMNEGKVDIDSLPVACTPIVVRAAPSTQHLRVPAPRT